MRKWWAKILGLAVTASLLFPEIVLAAGKKGAPIVVVADTRKFTGWEAAWTNLYNESHFWFTMLTVAIIPILGLSFGFLADWVMGFIGIDLKSRDLAEH